MAKGSRGEKQINDQSRRTTAVQELLALIAPLAKLGRFEVAADFFPSLCITISFLSGAIEPIPPGKL